MRRHRVEEFVKLDEVHALDVPVGPLHLTAKIYAVRQPRIQKRDDGLTVLVRYAHAALVHANG